MGMGKEAVARIAPFLTALSHDPAQSGAWNDIGLRFFEQGRLQEAVAALRRSLCLQPDNPGTWSNLGSAHQYRGEPGAAVEAFHQALSRAPQLAAIHINLGNALLEQGGAEDAAAAYRTALVLEPGLARAEMNLAGASLYRPGARLDEILTHARRWSAAIAIPADPAPMPESLRIGLISADFRQHAVGNLTIPALEGLARLGHHLTLYSNSLREDGLTGRFKACAAQWRMVAGLDDARLDAQIRADGIGILIDLSGFSAGNRMTALARKPAPIQIASWVGYPSTTGAPAMDYILADRHQVPEGAEIFYSETVIRLPDSYVSFEPPAEAPELGEPPGVRLGYVTFGSFNALKKINSRVIAAWGRLMRDLPDSRLVMKALGLDCAATRLRFLNAFAAEGIGADRITLVGNSSIADHLAWMQRADLALDPFPYSGGRTTLEALWMGLPVVTLPSDSFASRHSLGYLSTIGLQQWVARNADHYVELNAALARDPAALTEWRRSLRDRMLNSPLADTDRFARDLDRALREVWRKRQ